MGTLPTDWQAVGVQAVQVLQSHWVHQQVHQTNLIGVVWVQSSEDVPHCLLQERETQDIPQA